jgi:hypothetical protein
LATFSAHADDSGGKFLKLLGLTLNESTLLDVKAKLGSAQEFQVSEDHHETAVCYSIKGSTAIAAFSTDGEFGGPKKLLLGFKVRKSKPAGWSCELAPIDAANLVVDGLRLGMKESQARDLLGEPTRHLTDGMLKHTFESKRDFTPEEASRIAPQMSTGMDVTHSVWVVIAKGRVSEYGAWILETY